jgi:hypothetical protein
VLYFADLAWWQWHTAGVACAGFTAAEVAERFRTFAGLKVTVEPSGLQVTDPDVFMLHNSGTEELSVDRESLRTGRNGGYQALNFALLAGAERIVLLGYDMQARSGQTNWHAAHRRRSDACVYPLYRAEFARAAPLLAEAGVEVLNATPGSALRCFPSVELESVLPDPTAAPLPA